ncbi:MAG: L,D-transpeptidase family protein [Candidatus Nanopelagicales bacterium]
MSKQAFRKPLVALAACSVIASSLMLVSPANATEVATEEPVETSAPETPAAATPMQTETATPVPTKAPTTPAKKPTKRTTTPASKYTPAPSLSKVRAGKAILRVGMQGPAVKVLQRKLIAAGYFKLKATGIYDKATGKAVNGIREKNFMSEGTTANSRVVKSLWSMTTRGVPTVCKRQKKALCISKKQKVLRYYKRGKLVAVFDARFGQVGKTPTREGNFRVHTKIANGKSDLSGTWMPWALYFSRSQAVHFSPGFKSVGYYGASLGCVNIRDFKGVRWLYRQIPIGTFVKVYK